MITYKQFFGVFKQRILLNPLQTAAFVSEVLLIFSLASMAWLLFFACILGSIVSEMQ